MIEVSTSILNAEKKKLEETILALEKAKTDYFHIDVMDGKFVRENTYETMLEYSSFIKRISNLPLDIHLMVEDTKSAINDFFAFNPNLITFHLEACKNEEEVFECIDLIKQSNARVGIAIKPNTKLEEVYKFLPYIHICLVMAVEPGKGGQNFIPETLEKTEKLKKYNEQNNLEVRNRSRWWYKFSNT